MGLVTAAKGGDPATSQDGTYIPMKRSERQQCWDARDRYFKCLDQNDILDSIKDARQAKEKCGREEQGFEKDCATSWVCAFVFATNTTRLYRRALILIGSIGTIFQAEKGGRL